MDKYKAWFSEEQRKEFRALIEELATNQEFLNNSTVRYDTYIKLEKLYYRDGILYRHFYSDIFAIIKKIYQSETMDENVLGNNIEFLMENYMPKNCDENGQCIDIKNSIVKLYDHISLDIARLSFITGEDKELIKNERLSNIENTLKEEECEIQNLIDEKDELKRALQDQQRESVTVLGIFAAIVVAFVGEFAFSTSVLENVKKENFTYIISGAMLIGVVFVTGLYGLFYFLSKVTNMKTEIKWWHWVIPNLFIITVGMIAIFLNK